MKLQTLFILMLLEQEYSLNCGTEEIFGKMYDALKN